MRKCIISFLLVLIIVFVSCQYYSDALLGVGDYVTVKIQYNNKPANTKIVDIGFLMSDAGDKDFVYLDENTREWRWPEMTTQEDMNRFIDKHYAFGGDASNEDYIQGEIEAGTYSWLIYCEYENTTTSEISRFILMVHYHDINNIDSFMFEEGLEEGYHITIDLTEDRVVSIEPNYNDEVNLFNNVYATVNKSNVDYYDPYIYYDFIQNAQIVPQTTNDVVLTDIFVNDGVVYMSANDIDKALYYKCTPDIDTWICEEIILEDNGSAIIPKANSISVDTQNNDIVYVAGKFEDQVDYILKPCIWKDGPDITQITLPTPPNFSYLNLVSSIFIENGDIYVTGIYESNNTEYTEYISTIFKNTSGDWSATEYHTGLDMDYYIPTSIFSKNGELYISEVYSYNSTWEAYYWNNDQHTQLDNGMAMDIYYSNNGNLYTVGQYDNSGTPVPAYWLGTTVNELSTDDLKGSATSLYVIENNDGTETLYIAGYIEDINNGYFKAVYWIVDTDNTDIIEIKDSNNDNIYVEEIYPDLYNLIKPVSIFVERE